MTTSDTRFYDVSEPGTLHANTDVAVEPQFLPTIRRLATELGDPVDDQVFFTVTIVPEPDNPRSELGRALSVRWKDRVIGYLSARDADRYQQLRRIVASGWTPASRGRLFVASRVNSTRRDYFLSVSLRTPGKLIPLNDPPTQAWALLPHGKTLQVTGESAHLDVLLARVPEGGERQILVSLHEAGGEDSTVVEVRLDGQRVGELSAEAGAEVLPAVRHVDGKGLLPVARATLECSPLSAEVTVQAATASRLTAADLDPDVSPLPTLVPARQDARLYPVPDAWDGGGAATGDAGERKAGPEPAGPAEDSTAAGSVPSAPQNPFRPTPTTAGRTATHAGMRGGVPVAPVVGPGVAGMPAARQPAHPVRPGIPVQPGPSIQSSVGRTLRTVLLSVGIAVGALLVIGGLASFGDSVLTGTGGLLLGLSIIAPCTWPLMCRSRDRRALATWEKDQATSRELASYLTEEDAVVAEGLAPTPRPQPVPRQWKKVGTAAGVTAVVGFVLLGAGGDVSEDPADQSPPGVSSRE